MSELAIFNRDIIKNLALERGGNISFSDARWMNDGGYRWANSTRSWVNDSNRWTNSTRSWVNDGGSRWANSTRSWVNDSNRWANSTVSWDNGSRWTNSSPDDGK